MQIIRFTDDYQIETLVFERNAYWEYYDSYQAYLPKPCEHCGEEYVTVFRILIDGVYYSIPHTTVVKLSNEDVYNKDYTDKEWKKKITTDALVKDGDYVKAWKETFNINDPVKEDRSEQTDYDARWRDTARREKEYFERKDGDAGPNDIP